jgi:AbrB family looped-hinge helix DNA binding protein
MYECRVTLSAKGQIVIPAQVRKHLHSRDLKLVYDNGQIIISEESIEEKMKKFVARIDALNAKYSHISNEDIDVMTEIEKDGA